MKKKLFTILFSTIISLYLVELIYQLTKWISLLIIKITHRYCEDINNCDYRSSMDVYYESEKR